MVVTVSTADRRSVKALAVLGTSDRWVRGHRKADGRSFWAIPSQSAAGRSRGSTGSAREPWRAAQVALRGSLGARQALEDRLWRRSRPESAPSPGPLAGLFSVPLRKHFGGTRERGPGRCRPGPCRSSRRAARG